jgi:hypothetical protein
MGRPFFAAHANCPAVNVAGKPDGHSGGTALTHASCEHPRQFFPQFRTQRFHEEICSFLTPNARLQLLPEVGAT